MRLSGSSGTRARSCSSRHGFALAATLTEDRFGRDWFVMDKRLGRSRK
jgi:hypothetical protein